MHGWDQAGIGVQDRGSIQASNFRAWGQPQAGHVSALHNQAQVSGSPSKPAPHQGCSQRQPPLVPSRIGPTCHISKVTFGLLPALPAPAEAQDREPVPQCSLLVMVVVVVVVVVVMHGQGWDATDTSTPVRCMWGSVVRWGEADAPQQVRDGTRDGRLRHAPQPAAKIANGEHTAWRGRSA